MPEPQSTAFFVLMMVIFGALICWIVLTKQIVLRVVAACLAFLPAAAFGVAAVNKYYGYYQTWNSAFADISNQGGPATNLSNTHISSATGFSKLLGTTIYTKLAEQQGANLKLTLHGPASGLTRTAYVYLPPQYFRPAYQKYKFPVIELIHGFPGQPQDWITVVGVTTILSDLIREGRAKPVVLVMPDANGAPRVSLQCLNQYHGAQDATFLGWDVPSLLAQLLRVWPGGRSWGIAGYSEGGYCAANLGLRFSHRFSYAGVLSGYFRPGLNQLANPARLVSPFNGNKRRLAQNSPLAELQNLPPGAKVPQFWIGAGLGDRADVKDAELFQQAVQLRQPGVVLRLVPGGGHTMVTWRELVGPMLSWMTPQLATAAEQLALERLKQLAPTSSPPPSSSPRPGSNGSPSGKPSPAKSSPKPKRTPAKH